MLLHDRLLLNSLLERVSGGGLRARFVGLGLNLGLTQLQLSVAIEQHLLGCDLRLLRRLVGVGFGDLCRLANLCRLGTTDVRDVVSRVANLLNLQGVDNEALLRQRLFSCLEHALSNNRAISNDLQNRQAADDRTQRTRKHLLGRLIDLV